MVLLESKLNTLHDEVDQLFGAITQVTAYAPQEFVERWPRAGLTTQTLDERKNTRSP
jgi:hypothetical protein